MLGEDMVKAQTLLKAVALLICFCLGGCLSSAHDFGKAPTRSRREIIAIAEHAAWPDGKRDPSFTLEYLSYDYVRRQWGVSFAPNPCPPGGDVHIWIDDISGKTKRMPSM